MRRTTPLTTAALLGVALLTPATASAAGETCRGEAATIVGTGTTVTGTAGRDVIVTGPAGVVDALGGDDLVCVSGGPGNANLLSIDAGSGDDVVDATALTPGYYVTVVLGSGADVFAGGRSDETVFAGERTTQPGGSTAPGPDTDRDTVDTGEAGDFVHTGSAGTVNRDVVSLGLGDDGVSLGSVQVGAEASFDAGDGVDRMYLDAGDSDITLDMAAGTFTTPAGTGRATGVETVALTAGTSRVTYRGTPGNDTVDVSPAGGTPTLDIETGAGQDAIVVEPATIAPGSRIDGGIGRNTLTAANRSGSMDLDLEQGTFAIDGQRSTVAGIQDATFYVPWVSMVGDARGNNLAFSGCVGDLVGGRGRDRLLNVYDSFFESYVFDCRARTTMVGGPGADRLRGGQAGDRLSGDGGNDTIEGRGGPDRIRGGDGQDALDGGEGRDHVRGDGGRDSLAGRTGDDTLVGGAGNDAADGSTGRDRCVAERERGCER
ncbi:calcium-binding protein [Nocardioides zeicaulis]|uniref:Calcium-binding protein n=1 Tax=Nocardioides zeicaulis TaxID=1776857 RepID=A0ABV6E2S1_9ACTN